MNQTNLIYFGTPRFSAQILQFIHHNLPSIKIQAVITQPDRPTGRHQTITPSPVAQTAQKLKIPAVKPTKLNSSNLQHLQLLNPHLFLVVAFGQILPPSWLKTPKLTTLNLHFSLLPKHRGALCLQQAIKNQDKKTGVTLMQMDTKLDHGPLIAQITQPINQADNIATLTEKLTRKAQKLLTTTLPAYINFKQNSSTSPDKIKSRHISLYLPPQPQDHSQATYTPSLKTNTHANAFIPWPQINRALNGHQAPSTHALIRSLNPRPGAWTNIPTTKDKLKTKLIETNLKDNSLEIQKLQFPGKQPISFKQFTAGHTISN